MWGGGGFVVVNVIGNGVVLLCEEAQVLLQQALHVRLSKKKRERVMEGNSMEWRQVNRMG